MANLPHDLILRHILIDIPAKSLLKFKCVCKQWKSDLESWEFIKKHYNHWIHSNPKSSKLPSLVLTQDSSLYIIHDPSIPSLPIELTIPRSFRHNNGTLRVIGSCNGFVCVASGQGLNHYFIFNPYVPNSFKILPYARNMFSEDHWVWRQHPKPTVFLGFGFDCCKNDYKVVYGAYKVPSRFEVVVFSLNSGSWKSLNLVPDIETASWVSDGVAFNNCLHWCGCWKENRMIFSFDLHDEEWNELVIPDFPKGCFVTDFVVFKGCLSVLVSQGCFWDLNSELWVMKEYGVSESWTKVLTLPGNKQGNYVMCTPSPPRVLLQNTRGLCWYDVDDENVLQKAMDCVDIKFEASKAVSFVGSLVSVHAQTKLV